MAEKDQVIKEKLTFTGIMNFAGFYTYLHSWLKNEDYGVSEDKYSEKIVGNGKDIEAEWKVSKRISDYFKIEAKIEIKAYGLTDIEVTIDGQKKKMNKGKIELGINGVLVKDWDSKWEASPFTRFMRETYNKFIIPHRVLAIEEKIKGDMIKLKEEGKKYLEMTGQR